MAHAQKPDFVFRRHGEVHLNGRGRQFSRLLVAEVYGSAAVMLDTLMFRGSAKGTGYPLLSPVSPFTSFPVRHHVPSHFNWSLQRLRYWPDDREMLRFPTGEVYFLFSKASRPSPGPSQLPMQLAGEYFPGLKWQRLEADHLLPYSAKVKNAWHFTSIFPHAFTACDGTSVFTCMHIINKKAEGILK